MAAEKNEHSCSQDSNNHAGKFVYPLSIFSFLICITAMVRVEIINQRIDVVEDLMAEVNQIAKVHFGRDVTDLKNVQRVNLVDEFYRKNGVKEEEYTSKGKLNLLQYFTRGGGGLPCERDGDDHEKIRIKPFKETNLGTLQFIRPPCKSFLRNYFSVERLLNWGESTILSFFEWTQCGRLSIILKLKTF